MARRLLVLLAIAFSHPMKSMPVNKASEAHLSSHSCCQRKASMFGFCSLLSTQMGARSQSCKTPDWTCKALTDSAHFGAESSKSVKDFALLRSMVRTLRQRSTFEERSTRSSKSPKEKNDSRFHFKWHDSVTTVVHGLRLGRGIRYRYRTPYDWRTFLMGPALRQLVDKLHATARAVIMEPHLPQRLELNSHELHCVRDEVAQRHAAGERHLTLLTQLLAHHFTQGAYTATSIVTAHADGYSFTLSQPLPPSALCGGADSLRLAAEQLRELRVDMVDAYSGGHFLAQTHLLDHAMEFEAHRSNPAGVHRLLAHARPAAHLWRPLTDALFALDPALCFEEEDRLAADGGGMYVIQIIVDESSNADALHRRLRNFQFRDHDLREHGVLVTPSTRRLDLLDQSPLPPLTSDQAPQTQSNFFHTAVAEGGGQWCGGRTSVFAWMDTAVTVRVQTLCEFYEEAEAARAAGGESAVRLRGERPVSPRRRLADRAPLFDFSQRLLRWIISDGGDGDSAAAGRGAERLAFGRGNGRRGGVSCQPLHRRTGPPSCESIQVCVVDS